MLVFGVSDWRIGGENDYAVALDLGVPEQWMENESGLNLGQSFDFALDRTFKWPRKQ